MGVHLLLGNPHDAFCVSVRSALEARGYKTRIIANPLSHPSTFVWRLDNETSSSRVAFAEEPPVMDDHLSGVFVRTTGWINPAGWHPEDIGYVQAEAQAALLAWLWSLACPVVNRYPASIWYRPQAPLLSWQPLLRRCGLSAIETLVTNVEHEGNEFRRRLSMEGWAGAVYGPFSSDVRYFVIDDNEWAGLTAMQRSTPVCLTYPCEAAQLVCLVGEHVVWDGKAPPDMILLEPALRRFATMAGLDFVELALVSTTNGIRVLDVEPFPHVERFRDDARRQIVEGVSRLLTATVDYDHEAGASAYPRSLS